MTLHKRERPEVVSELTWEFFGMQVPVVGPNKINITNNNNNKHITKIPVVGPP